jgi:hypothetical protein
MVVNAGGVVSLSEREIRVMAFGGDGPNITNFLAERDRSVDVLLFEIDFIFTHFYTQAINFFQIILEIDNNYPIIAGLRFREQDVRHAVVIKGYRNNSRFPAGLGSGDIFYIDPITGVEHDAAISVFTDNELLEWIETLCVKYPVSQQITGIVDVEHILIDRVFTTTEAVLLPQIYMSTTEFTLGSNPVDKRTGIVKFFHQGKRIGNCKLAIYDASGNLVKKLIVSDKPSDNTGKRQVGSWDLKDEKGRHVVDGTYLVKGMIETVDGKKEKISLILGVR